MNSSPVPEISPFEPLKWSRRKLKLLLCFCIGSSSQAECVVSGVGTGALNCFLFAAARRVRRANKFGKGRQPDCQRAWIVIDNVVHAGAYLQCRHGSGGRVLDMDKRGDPGAGLDDRVLAFANLQRDAAALKI